VNEFELTDPAVPEADLPTETTPEIAPRTVDPVRAAAGRLGGFRAHRLADLGREYEREHGLKAGRQRLKQLIQLGRRCEVEHGLRPAPRRRVKKGDAWQEFVAALARVVKPEHRPAVEALAATLHSVSQEMAA